MAFSSGGVSLVLKRVCGLPTLWTYKVRLKLKEVDVRREE